MCSLDPYVNLNQKHADTVAGDFEDGKGRRLKSISSKKLMFPPISCVSNSEVHSVDVHAWSPSHVIYFIGVFIL